MKLLPSYAKQLDDVGHELLPSYPSSNEVVSLSTMNNELLPS
jgi:hypothetical protein